MWLRPALSFREALISVGELSSNLRLLLRKIDWRNLSFLQSVSPQLVDFFKFGDNYCQDG